MISIKKWFGSTDDNASMLPLYRGVVETGRQPHWYIEGQVPDTVDGRFEVIASLLSLVLLRLEQDEQCAKQTVWLTELFVEDMDGQLRSLGIGDYVVGKHVGKLMGALGGRIGALRDVFSGKQELEDVLLRNLYRGENPGEVALEHSAIKLRAFHGKLESSPVERLCKGDLPV